MPTLPFIPFVPFHQSFQDSSPSGAQGSRSSSHRCRRCFSLASGEGGGGGNATFSACRDLQKRCLVFSQWKSRDLTPLPSSSLPPLSVPHFLLLTTMSVVGNVWNRELQASAAAAMSVLVSAVVFSGFRSSSHPQRPR